MQFKRLSAERRRFLTRVIDTTRTRLERQQDRPNFDLEITDHFIDDVVAGTREKATLGSAGNQSVHISERVSEVEAQIFARHT